MFKAYKNCWNIHFIFRLPVYNKMIFSFYLCIFLCNFFSICVVCKFARSVWGQRDRGPVKKSPDSGQYHLHCRHCVNVAFDRESLKDKKERGSNLAFSLHCKKNKLIVNHVKKYWRFVLGWNLFVAKVFANKFRLWICMQVEIFVCRWRRFLQIATLNLIQWNSKLSAESQTVQAK